MAKLSPHFITVSINYCIIQLESIQKILWSLYFAWSWIIKSIIKCFSAVEPALLVHHCIKIRSQMYFGSNWKSYPNMILNLVVIVLHRKCRINPDSGLNYAFNTIKLCRFLSLPLRKHCKIVKLALKTLNSEIWKKNKHIYKLSCHL